MQLQLQALEKELSAGEQSTKTTTCTEIVLAGDESSFSQSDEDSDSREILNRNVVNEDVADRPWKFSKPLYALFLLCYLIH